MLLPCSVKSDDKNLIILHPYHTKNKKKIDSDVIFSSLNSVICLYGYV